MKNVNGFYRLGADYAAEEMIETRCITNFTAEERPIHCVDSSRDKYVVRKDNSWVVDNNGEMIVEKTFPMLKEVFIDESSKEIGRLAKDNDRKGIDRVIYNIESAANTISHKNDKKILKKFKEYTRD